MHIEISDRGYEFLMHQEYAGDREIKRLLSQSSEATGDYLWIGADHHLHADEVEMLAMRLKGWLKDRSLQLPGESVPLSCDHRGQQPKLTSSRSQEIRANDEKVDAN